MSLQNKSSSLRVIKLMQRCVFMYPPEGVKFTTKLIVKHFSLMLTMCLPLILGIHGNTYIAFQAGMVDEAVQSLHFQSICNFTIMVAYVYIKCGNKLWAAIHRIESDTFGTPQELIDEFKRIDKLTCVVFFNIAFSDFLITIFYREINIFCGGREMFNDRRYRCGYHSAVWFPFKEDEFINEWVLYIWYHLSETLSLPIYTSTGFFMIAVLKFIPIRLRHLRSRVEKIGEKEVPDLHQEVVYIAKYYMEIYQCAKELNSSLEYWLIISYTFAICILSTAGYIVLLGHHYMEIIGLLIFFIFLYIMCHIGQTWEDEHEKLVIAVCNLTWYNMTQKMKKNYSLLLGTVQCPIQLTARPKFLINYNLFLSVNRTAYSVLTFLSNSSA